MNDKKTLLEALRGLKVQTGSLVCLGCGHEHNCSTQGCAIIRQAERALDILADSEAARSDLAKRLAAEVQKSAQINEGAAILQKKLTETLEQLGQAKAERDAAVKCLEDAHACETCEHMDTHPDCDVECLGCQKDCTCRDCRDGSNFKWRGEPGETAMTNGDRFRHYTDEELVDLLYQDYLNFSDRDGTEDPSTKWCDMKGGCQGEETSECTTELHKACILRWLRSKVEEVTE